MEAVENFKRRRQTELKHGRISSMILLTFAPGATVVGEQME